MITGPVEADALSVLCAHWPAPASAAQAGVAEADATDRLASASQLVLAHGGQLGQASAQALTAVFRSGPLQADPGERAIRCGLALIDLAPALARPSLGVHSSAAAAGAGGTALVSAAAQLAACLARAAPAGRLRLSLAAVTPVRRLFDFEPLAPLAVAGLSAPLPTALLRPARPQRPQASPDRARPLVGRQTELAELQAAFGRLIGSAQASALTLLADPGIGKSRLLHEFDAWSQARPLPFQVLRGRATAQAQGQPFGLLGGLLRSFCQIELEPGELEPGELDPGDLDPGDLDPGDIDPGALDPREIARRPAALPARFEAAVLPWLQAGDSAGQGQRQAHLLGHLIGIGFAGSPHVAGLLGAPLQGQQLALQAAALLLRRLAGNGAAPLLLHIEDLQWADSQSLDFLDYLLEVNHDVALLIVATGRPALADRRPAWTRSQGPHRRVDLGPLDRAHSHQLATDRLKQLAELPTALIDLVLQDAAGHPGAIEARIALLIDQGVIIASGDDWAVNAARLRAARLPSTQDAVLQARLALLPVAERRALQGASVIGPMFGAQALGALGRSLAQALPALLQRELASSVAGPGAPAWFGFQQAALAPLAYASLAPHRRRALHARFAGWLGAISGPGAELSWGRSAHHFEQAGDQARAAEQHARAAESAHLRYASAAVMDHAGRGLALLARLPAGAGRRLLAWRLLKARIRMLEVAGDRAQHRRDVAALLALAEAMDDDSRRADAHLCSTLLAMLTTDYSAMQLAARQAMACAARCGDHARRLQAMRYFASAHFRLGDWDAGQRLARQCLGEARDRGLREVEAFCTNLLGIIATRQRDPLAGLRWDEQTLAAWRQLGDRNQEAISLCNIGESWLELGEPTLARRHLEDGEQLARACGNLIAQSAALSNLSVLARRQGDAERAVALAGQALAAAAAASSPEYQLIALQQLGEAELLRGQPAAAAQAFDAVLALALRQQLPAPPDAVAGLAALALAQDDLPTALQHTLRLLALDASGAVALGSLNPRRLALICHRVLSSAGDPRAGAWLRRAHDELLGVAATITDAGLREAFLNNIPDHRATLAAWALHAPTLSPHAECR